MLKMLEPITLALMTSVVFLSTAAIEENNSGKEVPMETIVTPTINGEIFRAKPIFSALSTNQSDPLTNKNKLTRKMKVQNINSIF
jgi:hypothetical protein